MKKTQRCLNFKTDTNVKQKLKKQCSKIKTDKIQELTLECELIWVTLFTL